MMCDVLLSEDDDNDDDNDNGLYVIATAVKES